MCEQGRRLWNEERGRDVLLLGARVEGKGKEQWTEKEKKGECSGTMGMNE